MPWSLVGCYQLPLVGHDPVLPLSLLWRLSHRLLHTRLHGVTGHKTGNLTVMTTWMSTLATYGTLSWDPLICSVNECGTTVHWLIITSLVCLQSIPHPWGQISVCIKDTRSVIYSSGYTCLACNTAVTSYCQYLDNAPVCISVFFVAISTKP
jgi:hypothetical protein